MQRSSSDSVTSAIAELRALLVLLPALVSDRVRLLTLELHRARNALAAMIVLTILAALMLATAWIALWAAITAWIVERGIGWGWAALIVMLINVVVAAALMLRVRTLGPMLALPATLRQLGAAPPPPPPPELPQ